MASRVSRALLMICGDRDRRRRTGLSALPGRPTGAVSPTLLARLARSTVQHRVDAARLLFGFGVGLGRTGAHAAADLLFDVDGGLFDVGSLRQCQVISG